ncbi:unnamed protein product [Dibothriocephalus latus]|uniref:Uncharacterized protein n=1 Tax=Dibothriocephalus latus TaxID=60516 RepID=A0A3P7N3Q1_DIBLA|nr:unnamed protein product [Dibothriocephalus latus]
MLQQEHTNLQNMVSSRLREVKLLYSLLQQVGHTPPKHMDELLAAGASSSSSSAFSSLPSSTETLPPFDALSSPQNPFEGSSPSSSRASTTSITAASASMLDLLVAEESPGPCGTLPPPN